MWKRGRAPSLWKIKSFESSFSWGKTCKSYQRRCFPRKRRGHKPSPLQWHKTHALLLNFFRVREWRARKVMFCSPSEKSLQNSYCTRRFKSSGFKFRSSWSCSASKSELTQDLESFVFRCCNIKPPQHALSVVRAGSTIVHGPQFIRHRGTTREPCPYKCRLSAQVSCTKCKHILGSVVPCEGVCKLHVSHLLPFRNQAKNIPSHKLWSSLFQN
jgi:hypothetical protein